MTEAQALQKLNMLCMDCGKYVSSQRSACSDCKVELSRQAIVYDFQVQKKMADEVAASTTAG